MRFLVDEDVPVKILPFHLDIHPPYWEDIAPLLGSLLAQIPAERLSEKLIVLRADGFEEFR